MKGESSYTVGNPGRAALEFRAGPPPGRIGHADIELSVAALPGMQVLAVTIRGLEHRATGTPRQDAFALSQRSAGSQAEVVAVVCDGVGGLSRSDEAATIASRHLATLGAAGVPWPDAFAQTNEQLRKAVEQLAAVDPVSDGMATTAVAVSVQRESRTWVGDVAWVGDSSCWHLRPDRQWSAITGSPDEDDADYHSADVSPLPSADGTCSLQRFRLDGGALFVMSDGIANPLRWSRDVQEALADWWERPPMPFTFAEQVSFARKSHVDDRTVIGIWPDRADP